MKQFTYILLLPLLLCVACGSDQHAETENEMFVVNELFLLRTEGLALCQIAENANPDKQVAQASRQLKAYYTATQQDFINLCAGRAIAMEEADFDTLWNQLQGLVIVDSVLDEGRFLEMASDNIMRSVVLHQIILQRQDWEDISYYAFKSLPKLYSQQQYLVEMQELRKEKKPLMNVANTIPATAL